MQKIACERNQSSNILFSHNTLSLVILPSHTDRAKNNPQKKEEIRPSGQAKTSSTFFTFNSYNRFCTSKTTDKQLKQPLGVSLLHMRDVVFCFVFRVCYALLASFKDWFLHVINHLQNLFKTHES